jgi:hypothetical protein
VSRPSPVKLSGLPHASICNRCRFIATIQNCVVKIGRMGLSRVERDDHAFMLEIDFYVFHPGKFPQHRSQLAHTLIAIFALSGDFDRFQDRVIGAFREKRVGWIRIAWSSWVHRFDFTYLTCGRRAAVALRYAIILNGVKDLALAGELSKPNCVIKDHR